MNVISEETVSPQNGWTGNVNSGQVLRITGRSVIDFNAFKREDIREFFDTARTRIYNLNLYPTKGHRLFSKQNNPMMRILEDGFAGFGLHDLQSGHGCADGMLSLLAPLEMTFENLPDPMGLFRNLDISQEGRIRPKPKGPPEPVSIDLEAEIDLICAIMNCPASETSASGAYATITIFQP
ncbi:MAG: hypothetical protein CMM52_04895 [Rhodospirillaceae bacterium]|nr:hypothetical protein [Rhodospirillaceae bacterium]|tara:strand:- start:8892 stop:9434 length:543 start_codon:yes stop_codon:yes gene_type:complete